MKAMTRLNRILAMEDSITKRYKLFIFCCRVLPHCELWETAIKEYSRLYELGY